MPKPSWIRLTPSQQQELDSIVKTPGWTIIARESMPSIFPPPFRDKIDSAVLIAAPTSTGGTYLAFNAIRVDYKDRALDQEPFAVIVHSTGADSEGMFLHHGNWAGRTVHPSTTFWDRVDESKIGSYFLAFPPSGMTSGTLDQLPEGYKNAFAEVTAWIRRSTVLRGEFLEEKPNKSLKYSARNM
jgi:hypothetical protein